ncbi:MAG: hypothetical protein ACI84O_000397 [Myxococcota bacterium]|jgi:uncharacterized protein (TIGR00299 family) protein
MRIFLNLYGGVAGDMLVSALYDCARDAKMDTTAADALLAALPFAGVNTEYATAMRKGIRGCTFKVTVNAAQPHRHLSDVLAIIDQLPLSVQAAKWSREAFELLATAEAKVHNTTRQQIHFHEVGAVDSIIDICLASLLLDLLDVDQIYSSPITVGSGMVKCEHGQMPVPAPATLELLRGLPSCGFALSGERATPTGVALLLAWKANFATRDAAITKHFGYGMGSADFEDRGNFLRVQLEEMSNASECVVELRTMVDDQSGEVIGHALEKIRQQNILEAYLLPVMAKESRPGFEVVVICDITQQQQLSQLMFELLGTLGIRVTVLQRDTLARCEVERDSVSHKLRMHSDSAQVLGAKPEFKQVVATSQEQHCSPRQLLKNLDEQSDA